MSLRLCKIVLRVRNVGLEPRLGIVELGAGPGGLIERGVTRGYRGFTGSDKPDRDRLCVSGVIDVVARSAQLAEGGKRRALSMTTMLS